MMKTTCSLLSLFLLMAPLASAQEFDFPGTVAPGDSASATAMSRLAKRAMPLYANDDRETYLDNLFRLQIVAGLYGEAAQTMGALVELRSTANPALLAATLPYEIYASALTAQQRDNLPFDEAFARSFRERFGRLDDRTAAHQARWVFGTSPIRLQNDLRGALDQQSEHTTIELAAAVDLVRKYLAAWAYGAFSPWVGPLMEEDDERRYVIERDILVRTPDGASICTLVVRPRAAAGRIPALLNFTIYADPEQNMYEARRTASHGYAGVEGLTRGKGCSPDDPVPIEHDGEDAAALIDWIAERPWSDGRVGMYGGSYEGFTQWAAARSLPAALKALMPSVTFAPGIDFPMEGNVFMNYAYPWPFYTTNTKTLDDATYFDNERWDRLNREWYVSGRAYRDLAEIDGTPNPIFYRWLDHPGYDDYWRRAIPSGDEFARITIPVLTTTGYYDSGQIGALYYLREHYRHVPNPEHYLLIGPYDHISGQRGTMSPLGRRAGMLRGYELDSVAHIDIGELRYQWFDYVFRGASKPALLNDRINYQVMGANAWKHAPSLAAMHGEMARFHMTTLAAGDGYRLSDSPDDGYVTQTVDLADREDVDRSGPGGEAINQALDTWSIIDTAPNIVNSIQFVSEPLAAPTEVSGLFSGRLAFVTNKRDFDFSVTLYELTPEGEYFHLSHYWARASYVGDRGRRRLLKPGEREQLAFESGRLTSRQLPAGSRLVVVLGILKQQGVQINYGTGGDVSDETIADAREPLHIQWFGDSFVEVPVRR